MHSMCLCKYRPRCLTDLLCMAIVAQGQRVLLIAVCLRTDQAPRGEATAVSSWLPLASVMVWAFPKGMTNIVLGGRHPQKAKLQDQVLLQASDSRLYLTMPQRMWHMRQPSLIATTCSETFNMLVYWRSCTRSPTKAFFSETHINSGQTCERRGGMVYVLFFPP